MNQDLSGYSITDSITGVSIASDIARFASTIALAGQLVAEDLGDGPESGSYYLVVNIDGQWWRVTLHAFALLRSHARAGPHG